jgi:hypothetical protein
MVGKQAEKPINFYDGTKINGKIFVPKGHFCAKNVPAKISHTKASELMEQKHIFIS